MNTMTIKMGLRIKKKIKIKKKEKEKEGKEKRGKERKEKREENKVLRGVRVRSPDSESAACASRVEKPNSTGDDHKWRS